MEQKHEKCQEIFRFIISNLVCMTKNKGKLSTKDQDQGHQVQKLLALFISNN